MFQQLLVSLGHKKEFNREGVAFWLLIKRRQKRVVGKLLQHQIAAKTLGQLMAERCLARTNIAFNGYEIVVGPRRLSVFHLYTLRLIVQHNHLRAVLAVHVKFIYLFFEYRMLKFWGDLHHGHQNESAFVQIRVGDFQSLVAN